MLNKRVPVDSNFFNYCSLSAPEGALYPRSYSGE